MPVTIKLSKLFYERLGEEVTNELVDWFNLVDATYRGDLKELNELNYARFDAKLEQRMTALEAKLEERIVRLDAKLDAKLDGAVAQHAFAQLDSKIDRGLAELRTTLEQGRTTLEKGLKDQTRWLFLAWSALLIPLIGILMRS